jgi:hypothetical protein
MKRKAKGGNARRRARDPDSIGARAIEDRSRHFTFDVETIGEAKQACGAQRQKLGVGGSKLQALNPPRRRLDLRNRCCGIVMLGQRIEGASCREQRTDRSAPHIQIGKTGAQRIARGIQSFGKPTETDRQQWFETLAQGCRQTRGGAPSADRNQHGIAIDNCGQGEVAQVRTVDDIDQQAARLEPGYGRLVAVGNDSQHRLRGIFTDDARARTFEQTRLRLGGRPVADQNDRPAFQPYEDGQAVRIGLG